MYIDAHCHLERDTYKEELDAVIERAFAAGLTHLVAVGASRRVRGAEEAVQLAEQREAISATVGLHPHEAADATEEDFARLAELLMHPKVVALGEIGLDFYYDNSPRARQREVFLRLLRLAREQPKPVMLHVRDAHPETWECIDAVGLPSGGGVVHCFTSGPDEAAEYLRRGMYLSIPGVVTFKNAEPLRQAVRQAPVERLLLETDCPYLAPVPHRGKRNEPAYITATATAVGAQHGLSGAEMGEVASENSRRLFALAG